MRKRLILVLVGIGILGAGGYSAYTYGLNVIGNKIADRLVVEAENNQQLLEQIDIPTIPESFISSETSVQSSEPGVTDKQVGNSNAVNLDQGQAESKSVQSKQTQQVAANDQEKQTATEKKDAVSFGGKQEAVKFVMSRFSASELNKLRQIASGGLTAEEKAELKKIAYTKFTSAEIAAVQKVVSSQ
ncbi:hypothetical protein ASG89_11765 [Paenibacillus sp. Soil766]|uniref:hypothetical protein n=1 Tax=Paenibacillus sp. Soil766 TaxID=1736404 RepID=UPI00070B324E|nr:hypothetical protein [Paenibacillus sp. Soil766]KRE83789.1 hypothetical protein ASG89_11765 [Paenibacillus sp. Soil766]